MFAALLKWVFISASYVPLGQIVDEVPASSYAGSTSTAVFPPPGADVTQNATYFPAASQVGLAGPTASMWRKQPHRICSTYDRIQPVTSQNPSLRLLQQSKLMSFPSPSLPLFPATVISHPTLPSILCVRGGISRPGFRWTQPITVYLTPPQRYRTDAKLRRCTSSLAMVPGTPPLETLHLRSLLLSYIALLNLRGSVLPDL